MSLSVEALLDKLCAATAYSEAALPSDHHHRIIEKVWSEVAKPALPEGNLSILDVGCGDGFAMQIFEANGHDAVGINRVEQDRLACAEKGLHCLSADMHYLGTLWDDKFDLVWARHIFEHSPFPMRALCEAHRVLKPGGLLYMEVPAPDTDCRHDDNNANHWSVLGQRAWGSLLARTGFDILQERALTFRAVAGEDKYFLWLCRKPL